MKTIVLIGAGQLGRRHLQALSKLRFGARIFVVDPVPASLAAAQSQWEEMPLSGETKQVSYLLSLAGVASEVDVAIVATSADVRAAVLRALLACCHVHHLVLEKVLFQDPAEYGEFAALFEDKGIKVWVNHPRRLFPFYAKVKDWLNGARQVSYQVQGGAWGLACNGLHFLDHLSFLTGDSALMLSGAALDPGIAESKRPGFIEVSGTLRGHMGAHPFSIFCHAAPAPAVITICSDTVNLIIDEANGWYRVARKDGQWKWEEGTEKIVHFQSELSHLMVEQIVDTGRCGLPAFSEASALHLPFIRCLLAHLAASGQPALTLCPIT
jgi:predicted dehydrogenase